MSSKETSLDKYPTKHKIFLRFNMFYNFLSDHDLYFPTNKYHVVNKMLIELSRFEKELKKIPYSQLKDRSK